MSRIQCVSGGSSTFWAPKSHTASPFACLLLGSCGGWVVWASRPLATVPSLVPCTLACQLGLRRFQEPPRTTLDDLDERVGVDPALRPPRRSVLFLSLCWFVRIRRPAPRQRGFCRVPRFPDHFRTNLRKHLPRREGSLGLLGETPPKTGDCRMGPAAFGRLAALVRAKPRARVASRLSPPAALPWWARPDAANRVEGEDYSQTKNGCQAPIDSTAFRPGWRMGISFGGLSRGRLGRLVPGQDMTGQGARYATDDPDRARLQRLPFFQGKGT